MRRDLQPELMDDPGLDPEEHRDALRGLGRIHRLSFTGSWLWSAMEDLAHTRGEVGVLDVACGGGRVAIDLWRRARSAPATVRITGLDRSPRAVDVAREEAAARGAAVEFLVGDALIGDLPRDYDVIMSSLFLHHLERDDAASLLRRMADAAGRRVLVDDLRRCRPGLLLARVATRLLSRSRVVHVDGPRSVRAAFTIAQARSLADRAGLEGVRVRRHWPFRFLLSAAAT